MLSEIKKFVKRDLINIKIRKFSLSDLDEILKIEKASFTQDAYPKSLFESFFKKYPEGFIVAELKGKIVGYTIGKISRDFGEIISIAVDPRVRFQGVGKALINNLIEDFRQKSIKTLFCEVRTTNKNGISFFENLDFCIIKTIKGFYQNGGDAFLMRRKL